MTTITTTIFKITMDFKGADEDNYDDDDDDDFDVEVGAGHR